MSRRSKQGKLELSENLTIAPVQCLACSKRPESLRTLSGIAILTSIKGHNSGINVRKMMCNNPDVNLVNMNAHIKLVKFNPFVPKILNGNKILA